MKLDFKIDKNKDTVLINIDNWVQNDSNIIQKYRMSGRNIPTYITKAIDVYDVNKSLKGYIRPGDTMLLTRIVADVAQYRGFKGPDGYTKYFSVPLMQVIGTFKDHKISLDNLNVLFDKVIYKKVELKSEGLLKDIEGVNNVGQVVKVGCCRFSEDWKPQPLTVKEGDYILVKDNISTEIVIDGEKYYSIEEGGIAGVFMNLELLSLDSVKFINGIVIMTPYVPPKMSKTSLLWTPNINYEDLDYSDIYCRNQFIVNYLDNNLTKIKKGDIVIIDRNVTTYLYFRNKKYFVTNGINYIEGRRT